MCFLDIQAKNIIISAKDDSIFREWDASEAADPSPRKVKDDYTIYLSRPFRRKKGWSGFGMPLLSDFGEARIGEVHNGLVQPDIYRAPEVILGMSWTAKVDIWNVGVLVCYETQPLPMYSFVCGLTQRLRSGISSRTTIYLMVGDQMVVILMPNSSRK